MCINDKEKKIISKIEEITGIRLKIDSELIVDKATKNIRKPTENSSGSKEIVFKDETGKEIARAQNLKDFEEVLLSLNGNVILKKAKNNDFSKWLGAIGEIELADKFKSIEHNFEDAEKLRKILIDILEEHRYSLNQAHVTNFQRYTREPHTKINRIGEGALGGKARGLTFLAELISKYISDDMFPGLRITVPRSIVLSTDVFDSFIDRNNLSDPNLYHLSDERIASKFMDASLPATIIGDLRSFVRNTRKPLVVRSSGLLEDSLFHIFHLALPQVEKVPLHV